MLNLESLLETLKCVNCITRFLVTFGNFEWNGNKYVIFSLVCLGVHKIMNGKERNMSS